MFKHHVVNAIRPAWYSFKHDQSSERNRIITPGCQTIDGVYIFTRGGINLGGGKLGGVLVLCFLLFGLPLTVPLLEYMLSEA